MAADNKSLGKFTLDGIPPAPRGVPQIEVTFDIDADGILKVSATDKATGRSQHITITASSGLSESEVEKMRRDAESHAEEDRKRRTLVEARNSADNAIYASEKALREVGDKVPAEVRSRVQSKVQATRAALETNFAENIQQATNALLQAMQEIGTAAYQGAGDNLGGGGAGGTGPKPSGGDPNVIDGEFKEG
jgi:molecular chaperone DnaK